ncbi:MAG: DUF3108 domain-containing protein [Gammaproteobacteria bacterium]|nr:DUF3108 domain-containing protein [Gammaproteobacteria bacterium]
MTQILIHLLLGLMLATTYRSADAVVDGVPLPESERLRYIVSYQGILTLGLPVEIAAATLLLRPGSERVDGSESRRAQLSVTTEPFPRMEAFYPLRFDYQSWLDPQLRRVSLISMRKQSGRLKRDLIWFDHRERQVRTYRMVDGGGSRGRAMPPARLHEVAGIDLSVPFEERSSLPLSGEPVVDRMGMLYLLRSSHLEPGQQLRIAVSNGKDLKAYRVVVEAREPIAFAGATTTALRLLLRPQFDDGSRGYRVRLWLSDDERALPLRFSSSKFGGVIELRLQAVDRVARREATR